MANIDSIQINNEIRRLMINVNTKLSNGKERIETRTNDIDILGLALLAYHGALEDHIRACLVSKVPISIKNEVLNPQSTNWRALLQYSKQYLGLNQQNVYLINEANQQRIPIAHGEGKLSWSRNKLIKYTNFVESWCSSHTIEFVTDYSPGAETHEETNNRDYPEKDYSYPEKKRIPGCLKIIIILTVLYFCGYLTIYLIAKMSGF